MWKLFKITQHAHSYHTSLKQLNSHEVSCMYFPFILKVLKPHLESKWGNVPHATAPIATVFSSFILITFLYNHPLLHSILTLFYKSLSPFHAFGMFKKFYCISIFKRLNNGNKRLNCFQDKCRRQHLSSSYRVWSKIVTGFHLESYLFHLQVNF